MPGNDDERLRFLRYSEESASLMEMNNNSAHIMGRFFTGDGESSWEDPNNEKHVLSIESAGSTKNVGLYFWVSSGDQKLKLHWEYGVGRYISYFLTIRFGPRWNL